MSISSFLQRIDPRIFHFIIQSVILIWAHLDGLFTQSWQAVILVILSSQILGIGLFQIINLSFNTKSSIAHGLSALNTLMSLLILLRLNHLGLWVVAALLANFSKVVFRLKGQHFFNPSNFAIVCLLVFFSDYTWVSPGTWSYHYGIILFSLMAGILITKRVGVLVMVLSFLGNYCALHFARSFGLGDPLSIAWQHLGNGSLLIFTFFTLSDPKTAPKDIFVQFLFGLLVALISFILEFSLFIRGSWFYALFIVNLLSPLLKIIYHPRKLLQENAL